MTAQDERILYLKIDGMQYGPVSSTTVKRWIEERRFGPNDYLRKIDQNAWVQAKNVAHLSMLFNQSRKLEGTRSFNNWIDAVDSDALVALTYEGQKAERERIRKEQQELEERREELEKLARQAEMTKEEAAELDERRRQLDEETRRLQSENEEIMRMESEVRRRRRRQTFIVVAIIAAVLGAGTWLTIELIGARADLEERIAAIDERLEAIDERLVALDERIERARATGDTELVEALEAERIKLEEERAGLEAELAEVEEERHVDTPEIEEEETEVQGRTGRIAVAGDVQITGAGSGHSDRSKTTVTAMVNSALSGARSTYNELLKTDPNASGSITLIFTINPDGSVSGTTGSNNKLPAGDLFGSMIRSLQGLRFQPIEDGPVKVSYPVSLTPN